MTERELKSIEKSSDKVKDLVSICRVKKKLVAGICYAIVGNPIWRTIGQCTPKEIQKINTIVVRFALEFYYKDNTCLSEFLEACHEEIFKDKKLLKKYG